MRPDSESAIRPASSETGLWETKSERHPVLVCGLRLGTVPHNFACSESMWHASALVWSMRLIQVEPSSRIRSMTDRPKGQ